MQCFSGIFIAVTILTVGNGLSWSKTYTLKAVLRIPSADIEEPYQIWTDGDTNNSRIDFYDGLDKMYKLNNGLGSFKYYKIHPESIENSASKNVCSIYAATDDVVKIIQIANYLPEKEFKRIGKERIGYTETTKWEYQLKYKSSGLDFEHTFNVWVKYVNSVNVPVRFDYLLKVGGVTMDYFRHDYTYFSTTKPEPEIFEIPSYLNCNIGTSLVHEPLDPLVEFIDPFIEDERLNKALDSFKFQYSKIYKDEAEHRERMHYFKNNLRLINSVNRQHKSYSLALNQFADHSDVELSKLNGLHISPNNFSLYVDDYPDGDDHFNDNEMTQYNLFDWRNFNAISSIKDQTVLCGSCYAFTSTAAIESTMFIYSGCRGIVKEASVQAIIDCTWKGPRKRGNSGCQYGDIPYTLSYIQKFGVPTQDSYGPYLAMKALVKNGPLALALNGKPKTFSFYSKGVYDSKECGNSNTDITHGVTLIGFGEEAGKEYWILKNSYGTKWGEYGFMRIAIDNNVCGVMNYVFQVQFKRKSNINKCFMKHNNVSLN